MRHCLRYTCAQLLSLLFVDEFARKCPGVHVEKQRSQNVDAMQNLLAYRKKTKVIINNSAQQYMHDANAWRVFDLLQELRSMRTAEVKDFWMTR